MHNYIFASAFPPKYIVVHRYGHHRNQPVVSIRLVDPDFRVTGYGCPRDETPIRRNSRGGPKRIFRFEVTGGISSAWEAGFSGPACLAESRGQKTFEMFTSEVTVNPPVKAAVFELPNAAQKVSERKRKK